MKAAITHLEGTEFQKSRAFSPAVITEGGKIVWLAGQTATVDESGKDISGNLVEQARVCFGLITKTLEKAGGSLDNLVWMTVFINDPRFGDEFVKIRAEIFKHGRFPASSLITVSHFARPGIVIEIQGLGVV
jgi:enamine deaminase RidA (YjgF/YER057c/UK114 family)